MLNIITQIGVITMLLFIGYHVGFNKGLDYGLHAKVEILLSKDTSEVIKHLKEESDQD